MSEASLPINGPQTVGVVAESMKSPYLPAPYPNRLALTTGHVRAPDDDFGLELGRGLDVVFDAASSATAQVGLVARRNSRFRSASFWVMAAARANSALASSPRPSRANRSPRTLGSRW